MCYEPVSREEGLEIAHDRSLPQCPECGHGVEHGPRCGLCEDDTHRACGDENAGGVFWCKRCQRDNATAWREQ